MFNPKAIKIIMVQKDLTVSMLAKNTGISEVSIRAILRGGDTKVSTLSRIAKALGCSIGDFFLSFDESKLSAAV